MNSFMAAPNQNYNGLPGSPVNFLTGGNPANAIPGLNTITGITGLGNVIGRRRK